MIRHHLGMVGNEEPDQIEIKGEQISGWGFWLLRARPKAGACLKLGEGESLSITTSLHRESFFLKRFSVQNLKSFVLCFMINQEVLFYFEIRIGTRKNVVPKLNRARTHFSWIPPHSFPVAWP